MNAIEAKRQQLLDNIQALPEELLQEAFEFINELCQKAEISRAQQPTAAKSEQSAYQALKESGLIGCIKDGPPDLSTNYKEYVTEYLEEKHGYR